MIHSSLSDRYQILVVDDEDTARSSLAAILRLEGYTVETAADGQAAIKLITDHWAANDRVDLVLLDLKMPGVDGLGVLRYLTNTTPDLFDINRPAVIMLTAHGSMESAIEALRYGACDYLLKPASPNQIVKCVARALDIRRASLANGRALDQVGLDPMKQMGEIAAPSLATTNSTYDQERGKRSTRLRIQNAQLAAEIQIDLLRREILIGDQEKIDLTIRLTPTEGKLLSVFLEHPGHVFTHRTLVAQVQGYAIKDWEAAQVLRPLVSRLRRKLRQIPGAGDWITSVRGTGYVFDLPA